MGGPSHPHVTVPAPSNAVVTIPWSIKHFFCMHPYGPGFQIIQSGFQVCRLGGKMGEGKLKSNSRIKDAVFHMSIPACRREDGC